MLYLKNTVGGLSRSLTESAVQAFQGPHRWWKLALYVAMFILPGGSLGVLLIAWLDGRRSKNLSACVSRTEIASSRSAAGRAARKGCEQRA
jgi:hypothetical protein